MQIYEDTGYDMFFFCVFFLRADPAATLTDYWLFGAYVAKFALLCSFLIAPVPSTHVTISYVQLSVLVLLSRPGVLHEKNKKNHS